VLTATGSLVARLFYWQTARASDHGKLDESTERELEARIADADRGDSSSNQPGCWGHSKVVVPDRDSTAVLDRGARPRAKGDRAAEPEGGSEPPQTGRQVDVSLAR
jgi:hypothetical protein